MIIGSVSDVITYIETRPSERDSLLLALQRYRGNSFVQDVTSEMRAKQVAAQKRAGPPIITGVTTQAMHHATASQEVTPPALDHKKPTSEQLLDHAQGAGNAILGQLVPGYIAARDRHDANAVASLGGQLSGVATHFYGALAAHAATPGDQTTEIKAQILKSMQPAVTAALASGLPPQMFRGRLVGPSPVAIEFSNAPNASHLPKLLGELERTIRMIELVHKLNAKFGPGAKAREDVHALAAARIEVVDWSGRALDLLFLKATLGPIWELLDATATPMDPKPSQGLEVASHEAQRVGWLGDRGRFDLAGATNMIQNGSDGDAALVLHDLYTADPDTRAKFLGELKKNNHLKKFCDNLSWEQVKQLHDSLGYGFAEIKTELQKYFIGNSKFGPSLGEEWENHDRSLHSLIGKVPVVGDGLNFALDVGTFGFHSSYGRALDDYSNGLTSPNEANSAEAHALMRTAAIALVSTFAGCAAGKMVRGGTRAVSGGRAAMSGAATGSVGAAAAVGTSDLYNNLVSKTQSGASSPEEYIKAMLLGGVLGGAFEFAGVKIGRGEAASPGEGFTTSKPQQPTKEKSSPELCAQDANEGAVETEVRGESGNSDHEVTATSKAASESKPAESTVRKPRGKKPYRGAPPKADVSFDELVELAPEVDESSLRALVNDLEVNGRHIKKPIAEVKDLVLEYKTLPKIQRALDLARDGGQGGNITPTSLQESFVGLKLESMGPPKGLKGPIKRFQGREAEFTDADGHAWDVKGPWSGQGEGAFKLVKTLESVQKELSEGHNVIVDTTKMKSEHIAELRSEIEAKGWNARVRWYP